MPIHYPSTGAAGVTHPVVFTESELRQVLGAYATGVMRHGWRDYAITGEAARTSFSVVERGHGEGANVLYRITKNRPAKTGGNPYFQVHVREALVMRTESFLGALDAFMNPEAHVPGRKLKIIR